MATSGNTKRKTTSGRSTRNTSGKKKTSGTKGSRTATKKRNQVDSSIKTEVTLIAIFAIAIFLFLCVTTIVKGVAAEAMRSFMFGCFGMLAYILPILLFLGVAFSLSNRGNSVAIIKLVSAGVLLVILGIWSYMMSNQESMITDGASLVSTLYTTSKETHAGGGVVFGLIAYGLHRLIGFWGTLFLTVVLAIISIVFITEKSFFKGISKSKAYLKEVAKEQRRLYEEYEQLELEDVYDEDELFETDTQDSKPLSKQKKKRTDKKVQGVISSTAATIVDNADVRSNVHEITIEDEDEPANIEEVTLTSTPFEPKPVEHTFLEELDTHPVTEKKAPQIFETSIEDMPEPKTEQTTKSRVQKARLNKEEKEEIAQEEENIATQILSNELNAPKKDHVFPPLSLLKQGENSKGDSSESLRKTALRLQQTLATFGVNVTVTDISQGPAVTRFELTPKEGVKVSKIVNLADDIKLNLAATDIRIEAPIPGKPAVGIEVPNKENSMVALRDLLDSDEFKNFNSNLAFAVGKDISGKVIVTDIAKMPHMLIAGATGSGKSVCINTIIMSILYKANPDDVKMILIDPKVVELSVYNDIPHLMIPVVTDPKKASAALHWGVAEMSERYKKFADLNVRDLKGYNKAVEQGKTNPEDGQPLTKLPQIVIIVDELADLMMVASKEVEESICRLAQLARAAGIHLIIATQRPSVDVITGLIKANMPSRIAFSVASGVDSRTILDMNGAEKLLGKGDMLFYPQGYPKPARVQGAFVSDSEVSDVVDFLKNQKLGNNTYDDQVSSKIEENMKSMQTPSNGSHSMESAGDSDDRDVYFTEAGRFVIEKEKASIGMLQRVYKIGFNRAARIMDQLEEAGVVGAEEGTKPRKILMTLEEFEAYLGGDNDEI